jgi:hypothetical protein
MGELISYSVSEYAIPIDPTDYSGGYGQLTYSELPSDNDVLDINTTGTITDSERGTFSGIIRRIEGSKEIVTFATDSVLAQFNRWFSVAPYHGTLKGYITYLSELAGVTAEVIYDPAVQDMIVNAPGFLGNVWDNLRQFAAINKFDIAQVADHIAVRPQRAFTAYKNHDTTTSYSMSTEQTTEKVTVYWYECVYGENVEIPLPGLDDDSTISVDAGSYFTQQYTIDGSLSSVNQPILFDYVDHDDTWNGTSGAYCIAGNDGKPITAAQWKAQGGGLFVNLTEDPSIIEVSVSAPPEEDYAPYRVATTAGTSSYYNSLHITGTGFQWVKHSVTVYTGAPKSTTTSESTTEFDSKFITTPAQAYEAAINIAQSLSGGEITVSGTSRSLNRPSDRRGSWDATMADYNTFAADNDISTMADWNTYFDGWTMAQWNGFWKERMSGIFENQAFGQVVGSRMRLDDGWYRVMSTTTGPDTVQYTLKKDTTMADWNTFAAEHDIATMNDWNSWYNGLRMIDFNSTSLKER